MWKYATKQGLPHIKKWKTSRSEVTYKSYIKFETRRKLKNLRKACEVKVSEFKISELIPSFSTPSPGSLAFTILLMTTRVFFIVITTRKVRDPGTLSYVADNS